MSTAEIVPDPLNLPYLEGCQRGELVLQRCDDCYRFQFYPRPRCGGCRSTSLSWLSASGIGLVHTFTVVHRPPSAAFAKDVPYVLALVDLAEGPRLMTRILTAPAEVYIGQVVEAVFDPSSVSGMPQFRPTAGAGDSRG